MKPNAAAAAALLALAGCAGVKVTRTGPDAGIAPKPSDCAIEFLQKAPQRPYDGLADLESHVTNVPPAGALQVLREPACKLGADAVIVTRNFVINYLGHTMVAGTAIRYRPEAPPPPQPEEAGQPPPATQPAPVTQPPPATQPPSTTQPPPVTQ